MDEFDDSGSGLPEDIGGADLGDMEAAETDIEIDVEKAMPPSGRSSGGARARKAAPKAPARPKAAVKKGGAKKAKKKAAPPKKAKKAKKAAKAKKAKKSASKGGKKKARRR
jgi:hypothetical protein